MAMAARNSCVYEKDLKWIKYMQVVRDECMLAASITRSKRNGLSDDTRLSHWSRLRFVGT